MAEVKLAHLELQGTGLSLEIHQISVAGKVGLRGGREEHLEVCVEGITLHQNSLSVVQKEWTR